MKKLSPRIERAIDIFLDAINEGTLAKGTCVACACGNLVAASMGIKPIVHKSFEEYREHRNLPNTNWVSATTNNLSIIKEWGPKDLGILQVENTGFTIEEFKDIEDAFEVNTKISYMYYSNYSKEEIRKDQIKGLEAVIKIMLKFEDDKENQVKEIFTNKAELISL